jgi:hypothetical protein
VSFKVHAKAIKALTAKVNDQSDKEYSDNALYLMQLDYPCTEQDVAKFLIRTINRRLLSAYIPIMDSEYSYSSECLEIDDRVLSQICKAINAEKENVTAFDKACIEHTFNLDKGATVTVQALTHKLAHTLVREMYSFDFADEMSDAIKL